MATTLDKIVDYKQLELEHQKRQESLKDVQLRLDDQEAPRRFLKNFIKGELNIIAEVKKASPSAGVIRQNFNPIDIAKIYEDHGAQSLSVLTDEHFFQGHIDYVNQIKADVTLPVLRKDFTLNEYHVFQGRAYGADAVLLIVAILDDYQLRDYHSLILELGMKPLIEIHNQEELDRLKDLDVDLLGINNRNLKTFETDVQVSKDLLENNEISGFVISESGLKDHESLVNLSQKGVSGFLIGESLMRSENIGEALKRIKGI